MSRTRALTGNARAVRHQADAVINSGVAHTYKYKTADYGTQLACKQVVRSLQKSFAALRCMDRQRKDNQFGDVEVAEYSKYDDLICRIGDLPNGEGAFIHFEPALNLLHVVEVETADGTPAPDFGAESRVEALFELLASKGPRGMSAADIALLRAKYGPIAALGDKSEEWAMIEGELKVIKPAEFSEHKTWAEYDAWKQAQKEAGL